MRDLLFHSSPTLAASHPPHTHTTAAPSVPPLVSPRQLVFFIFLSLSWFGGKESRKKEKIMSLNRWDVTTGTLIGFALWRVSLCVCVCCVATAVCVQNLRCISKDIEKSRTNEEPVCCLAASAWLLATKKKKTLAVVSFSLQCSTGRRGRWTSPVCRLVGYLAKSLCVCVWTSKKVYLFLRIYRNEGKWQVHESQVVAVCQCCSTMAYSSRRGVTWRTSLLSV